MMEIVADKAVLLEGLGVAQEFAAKRTTIPVLSHVLLETTKAGVNVVATDQEMGVRWHADAEVRTKGALCTEARRLFEIVRSLPEGRVTLRAAENYWAHIEGEGVQFKVVGADPREFPALPKAKGGGVTLAGSDLYTMIRRTVCSTDAKSERMFAQGVYFQQEEGALRLVSTDGHQMSAITRPATGALGSAALVPRRAVDVIAKVVEHEESVRVAIGDGLVHVSYEGMELSSRLIEAEFPDHKQAMPKDSPNRVVLAVEPLLDALRRVALVAREPSRTVKFTLDADKLTLSASDANVGDASQTLGVEYNGDPMHINFAGVYLIEMLSRLDGVEKVVLGMKTPLDPGVLTCVDDEQYTYVVMPIRD